MHIEHIHYNTLAEASHNERRLFTVVEARRAGFSAHAVRQQIRRGRWTAIAPGVLCATPVGPISEYERLVALVLASNGWACRTSTLALFELIGYPHQHHVVVERGRRNLDRLVVHSSRDLPESDLTVEAGVRTTTLERGLIDSAHTFSYRDATRLVTKAVVRRLVDHQALAIRADELRNSRRPGAAKVLTILGTLHPNIVAARNEWEALVVDVARRRGMPRCELNYRVETQNGPRFVDVAWPSVQRGIEYDGYWEHLTSRHRFEDDRWRDMDLRAAGWRLQRCNASMLRQDPSRIFGPIEDALAADA